MVNIIWYTDKQRENINELDLIRKAKEWDKKAKEELIKYHYPFLVNFVKKFSPKNEVDMQDMIQYAILGLLEAINNFDIERYTNGRNNFLTFARWYVFKRIKDFLSYKWFYLKIRDSKLYNDIRRIIKDRFYGEFIDDVDIDLVIDILENEFGYSNIDKSKVEYYINIYFIKIFSLDEVYGEDWTYHEIIPDNKDNSLDVENRIFSEEVKSKIYEVLTILTDREKKILILRYWLDGKQPMTLNEVGEVMGISRERVRQIEHKALRKLKKKLWRKWVEWVKYIKYNQ